MKTCFNHPYTKAFSICHGCGKDYCEECLDEGKEFYYCREADCVKLYKAELSSIDISDEDEARDVECPNCKNILELTEEEQSSGKVHCPECEAFIDFNADPPKVLDREYYVELTASLNQGDIAVFKSLLANANIDYYIFGENFLGADPLIQPARFYVNEKQLEEAKELLKDFDIHVWGTSNNE
jgi:uncharacterized protein YbaR (Trm112 family)